MPITNELYKIAKSHHIPKKAYTHCLHFVSEVMLKESYHFRRIDTRPILDGFTMTYVCNLDNRMYDVFIKPKKENL